MENAKETTARMRRLSFTAFFLNNVSAEECSIDATVFCDSISGNK